MTYLEEFKRRCAKIDRQVLRPSRVFPDGPGRYQVTKYDGNEKYIIVWNVTYQEACILLNHLHEKLLRVSEPNNIGTPYFKLERYEIVLSQKESST